ncbi:MAG: Zn-dependent hydrolase [Longimicrobiales bacterium]
MMNRRQFSRLASMGLAGTWLDGLSPRIRAAGEGRARMPQGLAADARRLDERMRTLATFGSNEAGGIDRVAFSDANIEALDWCAGHLRDVGFSIERDLVGNLVARKAGSDASLDPIMFGSHIDSVPGGGNYDGQVGSMGAMEVAAVLADAGHTTRHPLEVVYFTNEEGGKTGSRALVGEVEPFELDIETASGFTIGEGLRRLGGDPERLSEARRAPGTLAAFVELHVEQGAVLDQDDLDIGVVEGIVGIMRWNVVVDGMTNHAGTTPMDRRQDAMVGAARFVTAAHRVARDTPGRQVATVGRLQAEPGAPNVIPGRVRMTLEIRDLSMEGIERTFAAIRVRASDIADATGVRFSFDRFYTSRAAPTDMAIRDMVERSATERGLTSMRMPSGAGHDAQSIALLCPVGMIFVPSLRGISHAPEERTEAVDIVNGTNVLLDTLLAIDAGGLG